MPDSVPVLSGLKSSAPTTAASPSTSCWGANGQWVDIAATIAAAVAAALPPGIIAEWSGSAASIPSGWALCDGNNGTPDLRGRFVVGAGGAYNPGDTGGAASGVPSGTVSQPIFTGNALAGHTHGVGSYANSSDSAGTPAGNISTPTISWPAGVPTNTAPAFTGTAWTPPAISWPAGVPTAANEAFPQHTHAITQSAFTTNKFTVNAGGATALTGGGVVTTPSGLAGNHTHVISWPAGVPTIAAYTPAGSVAAPVISWPAGVPTSSTPTFTGSALAGHTHTISGSSGSTSAGTPAGTVSQPTFTGDSMSILPPYYAICFIMKL